jgi:3D (Asp-Asp-Asp) domain-containing protein
MLFAESLSRKAAVIVIATGGIFWFLEARMFDSQHARRGAGAEGPAPVPSAGSVVTFTATAYCTGTVTSAGVAPQRGVAAADRSVLPTGSIVELDTGEPMMSGLYTVLDTGPNMKGRRIDLYTKNCADAVRFGRRSVQLTVLRHGWSPGAPTPGGVVGRRFTPKEPPSQPTRDPLPSRTLPVVGAPGH